MAGFKATKGQRTPNIVKMWNGHPVRVTILYSGKSKTKCGVWRDSKGEPNLCCTADGTPILYHQIPLHSDTPTEHTQ